MDDVAASQQAIAKFDGLVEEQRRHRRLSAAGFALAERVLECHHLFFFRTGDGSRFHIPAVLHERLTRDLRRRDGTPATPHKLILLGLDVVADPLLKEGEAELRDKDGKLLGKIVNIEVPPEEP